MLKIKKEEVDTLIDFVEKNIPHKTENKIQSAKKVNSNGSSKYAVVKLMETITGLIIDSVIDGNLPPRETIERLLAIYKLNRHPN